MSLLVVASVGAGKTAMLQHLNTVDGILYCNDITPYSLMQEHGNAMKKGKIKHLVIADLLNPLSKAKEQRDPFITFFNSLIEDGVARIESRLIKYTAKVPVNVGLISSIAHQDFENHRKQFAAVGFLSRMLPISYSYSDVTVDEIFESIFSGAYRDDDNFNLDLPEMTKVKLDPKVARLLTVYAKQTKDAADVYGFRRQHQLQTMAMAHALGRGRDEVTQVDIDAIAYYSQYMNYDCKKEL